MNSVPIFFKNEKLFFRFAVKTKYLVHKLKNEIFNFLSNYERFVMSWRSISNRFIPLTQLSVTFLFLELTYESKDFFQQLKSTDQLVVSNDYNYLFFISNKS